MSRPLPNPPQVGGNSARGRNHIKAGTANDAVPAFSLPMQKKKFSFCLVFCSLNRIFAHGILNDILKMSQYNSISTPSTEGFRNDNIRADEARNH